jgi:hypothetical protein
MRLRKEENRRKAAKSKRTDKKGIILLGPNPGLFVISDQ